MWVKNKQQSGFTIVELLIVIVVIGILATITIVSFSGVQVKARDTVRINDLKTIQRYVEAYNAMNGSYPLPADGIGAWSGNCTVFGAKTDYISNITTVTQSKMPLEAKFKSTDNKCYLYQSNGTDYMILGWNIMEGICGGDPGNACNSADIRALDRVSAVELSIALYSPGARLW